MGLTAAQVRSLNEQKPPKRVTVTADGRLTCPPKHPVLELTAGSAFDINELYVNNGNKDGFTVEVRIATGSSAITFVETGNIVTTGSTLALGADDSAKFRYNLTDAKWKQIATTNL